ncbi:bifunctional phosphopantothenoylcysteine decarboxylase/phosphopantothenate--cysteine ligase CoaBC [Pelagicoccus albus]|uniref:Coenzyme A biosynthesis bifunctional protein CoaBC n=2 Tax=Pelagicoccus albus TaxID=415222 RepID=A0A7X1B6G1_9BACT|nr:bifunctional phosphopantothenoylcysteine decarboxylase/phosphopantothenate--cysteine ligase CoaBC [Pelagicoccus albus]
MSSLSGKRITLIVTGSIAAYKALELIRLLTKAGASVEGVLTEGGEAFITPLSVEALTGRRAHTKMWDEHSFEMNHIELSRRADLIVIAPATAGIVAKMANGLGDDLASSVLLARNKPVLIAPSMNTAMWENAAFRRNLSQVEADGAIIVPPQTDTLACGEVGEGKMAEPSTVLQAIANHFDSAETLKGKTAIVTAGGTIERIDSVRYISNFSSGKQGNAIAISLAKAGADVTLVAGNIKDPAPQHPKLRVVSVESALEMKAAVHNSLPADIYVGCAAVCDFRVSNSSDSKIKKESGLDLTFEENPDIAKSVGTLPEGQRPSVVIGFAAETDNLIEYAQKKLASKNCDLIVANNVSNGSVFGKDSNTVHFVEKDSIQSLQELPKSEVATQLVDWIAKQFQGSD